MPRPLGGWCLWPVTLTLPALRSAVTPLGDQERGGAPSLGGGALQRGGGDRGGGQEFSQAHPQLDHSGKRMGAEGAESWGCGCPPETHSVQGTKGRLVDQPHCWTSEATVALEARGERGHVVSLAVGRPGGVVTERE